MLRLICCQISSEHHLNTLTKIGLVTLLVYWVLTLLLKLIASNFLWFKWSQETLTGWQYCRMCHNWLSWRGLSPLISQLVSQQQSSISVVMAYSNAVFLHPHDEMQPISTETITAIWFGINGVFVYCLLEQQKPLAHKTLLSQEPRLALFTQIQFKETTWH